jgi:hypothetical protein
MPKLTDLTALAGLTTVGAGVHLDMLDSLTSLHGLEGLTTIPNGIEVTNNAKLASLKGLDNVTSVGLDVTIQSNPDLTSLAALNAVTTIGAAGPQYGNGIPCDGVTIENDNALTVLDGFGNLTQMGLAAQIVIDNDKALATITAFAKLTSIDGPIEVSFLPKLTSLGTLAALTSADASGAALASGFSFDMESDPLLPTCQAQKLLATFQANGFTGKSNITNDGPGTCP